MDDDEDDDISGRWRPDDPETSKEAGRKFKSKQVMAQMIALMDAREEGYTCTEMEVATEIKRDTLTPRIRKLREQGQIVRTNLKRRYGDRPGETMRPGQHRECTVYKSTKYALPEEIVPIPPPSLLGEIIMLATRPNKYLHYHGGKYSWSGTIPSMGITVHGKYQGAVRAAAKTAVRRLLAPHFVTDTATEAEEDTEDWGDHEIETKAEPDIAPPPVIGICQFYVVTAIGHRICGQPTLPDQPRCETHMSTFRLFC